MHFCVSLFVFIFLFFSTPPSFVLKWWCPTVPMVSAICFLLSPGILMCIQQSVRNNGRPHPEHSGFLFNLVPRILQLPATSFSGESCFVDWGGALKFCRQDMCRTFFFSKTESRNLKQSWNMRVYNRTQTGSQSAKISTQ